MDVQDATGATGGQTPSLRVLAGGDMTADKAAWAALGDCTARQVDLPGVTGATRARLIELERSFRDLSGERPRRVPREMRGGQEPA